MGKGAKESSFGFPISARRLCAGLSRMVWADRFRMWLKKVTLERAAARVRYCSESCGCGCSVRPSFKLLIGKMPEDLLYCRQRNVYTWKQASVQAASAAYTLRR